MHYGSELELKNSLGIETWRNFSKDSFFRFLEHLPDTDPEVALRLVDQVPEITAVARSVLEDSTQAYQEALASNARSQEMVHEIHLKRLEILQAELEKDLSPEAQLRVLDDIREVNANVLLVNTENKRFLSDQLDKKLASAAVASAAVVVAVVAIVKSGNVPKLGLPRGFRS